MIRFFQFSVLIVILLVARRLLYRWLRQRDTLPELISQGLRVVVGYLVYVMIGLLALSWVAGRGFGEGNQAIAVLITLASAGYVGLGIAGLWLFLRLSDERAADKKRRG
jgi:hypothetical protein